MSHSAVLGIQQVIYSCELMDLRLEKIELLALRDWDVLVDAIHFAPLVTLSLRKSDIRNIEKILGRMDE